MTEYRYAEWTDVECPKCGSNFVARDKFGLFCCVSECGWNKLESCCPYCGKALDKTERGVPLTERSLT